MTFVEYARARRMGLAMKHIQKGNLVINAQLSSGYESGSGFRDAFSKIMGAAPTKSECRILNATWLDTKLGPMVSIADNEGLYLLEFVDRRGLELEVERLRKGLSAAIIPEETPIIKQLKIELEQYFQGENIIFKTPLNLVGTPFQKQV
ncbi:MAG: AraC family transcriptional regulator of adaptative response [Francisella sp.]|jgi:AraC family transcriptional regulator of adaptative response/methylated-DNA-[protein]-cysteine methyltransferase